MRRLLSLGICDCASRLHRFGVIVVAVLASVHVGAMSYSNPDFDVPVFLGDRLIVTGPGQPAFHVYCISTNGGLLWDFSTGTNIATAFTPDAKRLLITIGGKVYEADPAKGSLESRYESGSLFCHLESDGPKRAFLHELGTGPEAVSLIDLEAWTNKWRLTNCLGFVAKKDDFLLCQMANYVSSNSFTSSYVTAIDRVSGEELWMVDDSRLSEIGSAAAAKNYFVAATFSELYCFESRTGKRLRKTSINNKDGFITITAYEPNVIVAVESWRNRGEATLYVYSVPQLKRIRKLGRMDRVSAAFLLYENYLIGPGAFDLKRGRQIWKTFVRADGVHDGVLYFSSADERAGIAFVNSIELKTGKTRRLFERDIPRF